MSRLEALAEERAAALALVEMPLTEMFAGQAELRAFFARRGWARCADYLDNALAALALRRTADPRLPGDLGMGRVAHALQAAGSTLAAAFDAEGGE